ncbi:MAG TPA: DUF4292 domain-containing protein [Paludibacter sp.]|nr:DUF4292 domain-containing protein [Paludibacter sp.]
MKNKIILFLCCALMLLSACKTTRVVQKHGGKVQVAQVIENVQKQQPRFATANVNKMTMEFEMNGRKVNVSASCKIQADSAIYLSVQPLLGIELFKAELTTDSIRVFDKMNNRYFVADYALLSRKFGVDVDFHSLQSLIFGQFFCIGKDKQIPLDSCKLSTSANGYLVEYAGPKISQSTEISPDYFIRDVTLKSIRGDYQLRASYGDYIAQETVNYPQKIMLQASGRQSQATVDFSILRVDFNKTLKFQPANASRYDRGDIEQLLKK